MDKEDLISVREASQKLGISEQLVRTKLRDGDLKGKKLFGRWRVFASEVKRILS